MKGAETYIKSQSEKEVTSRNWDSCLGYKSSPDSFPGILTGKLRKPEGAEALLLRSMLAAPRKASRMENLSSGASCHPAQLCQQPNAHQ